MVNLLSRLKPLAARKNGDYSSGVKALLQNASIEVMPRTASKIEYFRALFPAETRVYIAHVEGTPIGEMVQTARRLQEEGFPAMPHFPARSIRNRAELRDWISRYQNEAGVDQALVVAGGASRPIGEFESSMQLLDTGLFEKTGFRHLHVAGHPEGNRDIDPDKGRRNADAALLWKQDYRRQSRAEMAIVTQFCFTAAPVLDWIAHLRQIGISLPVHLGVAGPANLQTLIKYAIACGVGPSLSVLQRRAMDLKQLVRPYEPTEVLGSLIKARGEHDGSLLPDAIHVFPFGGIAASANYLARFVARTVD